MPAFDAVPRDRRRALVADPDDLYRRALANLLATRGFAVEEAAEGAHALCLAVQSCPGLILSEARLPGLDGFGLCRRVRRHNLLCHTPVVLITAAEQPGDRDRALEAGADDCLPRRLSVHDFLDRVRRVLLSPAAAGSAGAELSGRLGLLTPQAILQSCHLAGLSGRLLATSGVRRVGIGFRRGEVVSADSTEGQGLEALVAFASWTEGVFEFTAGEPGDGTPLEDRCFEWLLLETCRRLDESRREA